MTTECLCQAIHTLLFYMIYLYRTFQFANKRHFSPNKILIIKIDNDKVQIYRPSGLS